MKRTTDVGEHMARRQFLLRAGTSAVAPMAVVTANACSEEPLERSQFMTGIQVRNACRRGIWKEQTSGMAAGFAQANLVVLPRKFAYDFLLFCRRNPKPCPLLDVTEPGEVTPRKVASNADLRTDLPKYVVWKNGEPVDEPTDVSDLWQDDFVSFIIGCSFTFESALLRADLPVRHIELGVNVPMYETNIMCAKAGVFHGPTVVSMRPMTPKQAIRAVQITSRFPDVHGAPVHLAMPAQIGIPDLAKPDFGAPVPVRRGEIPVFWACGVTAQTVLKATKLPFVITHSPGCMFVTDVRDESLAAG